MELTDAQLWALAQCARGHVVYGADKRFWNVASGQYMRDEAMSALQRQGLIRRGPATTVLHLTRAGRDARLRSGRVG
jgi:hypothetical protein